MILENALLITFQRDLVHHRIFSVKNILDALIDREDAEGIFLELRMDLCVQTRGGRTGLQRWWGLERKERYAIEESGLVSYHREKSHIYKMQILIAVIEMRN